MYDVLIQCAAFTFMHMADAMPNRRIHSTYDLGTSSTLLYRLNYRNAGSASPLENVLLVYHLSFCLYPRKQHSSCKAFPPTSESLILYPEG